MFVREYVYMRLRRQSLSAARKHIRLKAQHNWGVDEPGPVKDLFLVQRCLFAQNDTYLELTNPGWDFRWRIGIMMFYVVMPALFIIWSWYGLAVHPVLTGKYFMFVPEPMYPAESGDLWFGWLLPFPMALGCFYMLHLLFFAQGGITAWFGMLRGRIRFNRKTRKVYVLRPDSCGGNVVLDWDRLVCLMDPKAKNPWNDLRIEAVALYHPPFDANDPEAKGEDCIFFGPSLVLGEREGGSVWEYVRRFMQVGPEIEAMPDKPTDADFNFLPRYPPANYFTYCGAPSDEQYKLEMNPSFMDTACHMLTQSTCTWPRFPPEWHSDSGLGEPEDHPVRTGSVMTALVYRAEGKLSAEDEVELMTHYGTLEGLAEAQAKLAAAKNAPASKAVAE